MPPRQQHPRAPPILPHRSHILVAAFIILFSILFTSYTPILHSAIQAQRSLPRMQAVFRSAAARLRHPALYFRSTIPDPRAVATVGGVFSSTSAHVHSSATVTDTAEPMSTDSTSSSGTAQTSSNPVSSFSSTMTIEHPAESTTLALPAIPDPSSNTPAYNLDVSSGQAVKLDHLGPVVVNTDGTLSRIANWDGMTEGERRGVLKVLGRRNKERLEALKRSDIEGDL